MGMLLAGCEAAWRGPGVNLGTDIHWRSRASHEPGPSPGTVPLCCSVPIREHLLGLAGVKAGFISNPL